MATLCFTFPSKILHSQAEIRAVIPDKGDDCAVLWVLHGANADCNEWFTDSSIVRLARQYNLAVVSTSIFNGFGVNMAHGARYADYLETEWVPAVRAILPCLSEKKRKTLSRAFPWAASRHSGWPSTGRTCSAVRGRLQAPSGCR